MGIDWTQYLAGMQQANQPAASSLFPATPWSNLASAIRTVGIGMAAPKAQAQTQMTNMLDQAKAFGLPGLRKLYADPQFQSLAKTTGATLPPLPDKSPQEVLADRESAYMQEAQAQATALGQTTVPETTTPSTYTGGKGEEQYVPGKTTPAHPYQVTSSDWQRIYNSLAAKYPEAAEQLGIVKPIPPSEMAALIRSGLDYRTDPRNLMTMINATLEMNHQSWDTLDDQTRQMIMQGQVSPYMQAQLDNLHANMQAKLAQAGKTTIETQQMLAEFDTKLADEKAKLQLDINKGDLVKFQADLVEINTRYQAQIDQTKVAVGQSTVTLNNARANLANADVGYHSALAHLANVRSNVLQVSYPPTIAGQKAKAQGYYNLMQEVGRDMDRLMKYQSGQMTLPTGVTDKDIQDMLDKDRQDLTNYQAQYNAAITGIGAQGITTPLAQPDVSHANPGVKTALDHTFSNTPTWTGTPQQIRANVVNAFNQWRQNPGTKGWSAQDWQTLWDSLVWKAGTINVPVVDSMPTGAP